MAINKNIFSDTASKGEVALISIQASIALGAVRDALMIMSAQTHVDITSEISRLREAMAEIDKQFDRLTGWTDDEK